MSGLALAGLAGLNTLYLLAGLAFLWLVRGPGDWVDAVRLLGLAYLVGLVVTGSLWTLLLIAGVPFSTGMVVGLPRRLSSRSSLRA